MVLWWDSHHASQICCNKSPCPHGRPLLTHASTEDTQLLKACLAQSLVGSLDSGLDVHKVLFDPSKHHWWVWGLILNSIFPSYYPVAASPLPLDEGYLFLVGSRITLSMAVQQLIAILEFSQEKMSTYLYTPPSCIRYKLIISSKWIKNLNVRPNAVKFLAKYVGRTLSDTNCSSTFFNPSPKIMEIKKK